MKRIAEFAMGSFMGLSVAFAVWGLFIPISVDKYCVKYPHSTICYTPLNANEDN